MIIIWEMLTYALRAHVKDFCIGNCVNLLLKKFNINFFFN